MPTPLDRMKAELELEDTIARGEVFCEKINGKMYYYTLKHIGSYVKIKQQINVDLLIGATA